MCRIAGYVGTREIEPSRLDACLAVMRRRGPDRAAHRCRTTAGRRAYLLSLRLRIIDLDPRSNQPLQVGRKWMTCNGQAYNAQIRSFLDVCESAVRQWLIGPSPIFEYVRRDCIETLSDRPVLPNSDSKFLFSFVSCKTFLEAFAA